jgi:hypothetical protein
MIFEEAAKIISEKYQISSWIAANQFTKLPLAEWIGSGGDAFYATYGWPEVIKKAIALEVENLNREIERRNNEAKMAMKEQIKPSLDAISNIKSNAALDKTFR